MELPKTEGNAMAEAERRETRAIENFILPCLEVRSSAELKVVM